jgi:tetratricopeptide (TPR) repeat protein
VLTRGLFERLARPQWFSPVVVCVCAGLAFASCLRVGLWQTKLSLWSDCVAKSPRKARAHLGLGNALGKEGDLLAAMAELRTALELARVDPLWLRQEIRGKLGTSSLMLGRPDDAVAYAQAGLVEQPKNGSLLGLLAVAYLNQRNLPGAEAAAEASVRASPEPASSLQILSRIRRAKNDKEGEVAALEQAVQMDPSEPQGRLLLAIAYHEQGRLQQACEVLRAPAMERLPQVTQMLADCLSP